MELERMLLLSGAMGAGKTVVASLLEADHAFRRLSTSGYLRTYGQGLGPAGERLQLQDLGDRLDRETDYRWVVDEVALPAFSNIPTEQRWLLDAARKPRQVAHFRAALGDAVCHVHLTAPESVLRTRYEQRLTAHDTPYTTAVAHPNEVAARGLECIADVVVDTGTVTPEQAVQQIVLLWGR